MCVCVCVRERERERVHNTEKFTIYAEVLQCQFHSENYTTFHPLTSLSSLSLSPVYMTTVSLSPTLLFSPTDLAAVTRSPQHPVSSRSLLKELLGPRAGGPLQDMGRWDTQHLNYLAHLVHLRGGGREGENGSL